MLNIESNPHFTASSKCIGEEQSTLQKLLWNWKLEAVQGCMKMKCSKEPSTLVLFLAADTINAKDWKMALCRVDCLIIRYKTGPTHSLWAAPYSGGTGREKALLLVWGWRGGWKTGHCRRLHPGTGTTRALWQYRSRSWCLGSGRHREDWSRGLRMVRQWWCCLRHQHCNLEL